MQSCCSAHNVSLWVVALPLSHPGSAHKQCSTSLHILTHLPPSATKPTRASHCAFTWQTLLPHIDWLFPVLSGCAQHLPYTLSAYQTVLMAASRCLSVSQVCNAMLVVKQTCDFGVSASMLLPSSLSKGDVYHMHFLSPLEYPHQCPFLNCAAC